MPKFDAEDFVDDLYSAFDEAESPAAIDRIFKKEVFSLSAAKRKAVAEELERDFVEGSIESYADDIRQKGAEAVKQEEKERLLLYPRSTDAEAVMDAQLAAQIFFNIRKLKGKKVSPLVKAFTAAVKKLTDAEYNSAELIFRMSDTAVDAVAAAKPPAPPQNPFRKGKHKPRP